jgi:hypothetical protein
MIATVLNSGSINLPFWFGLDSCLLGFGFPTDQTIISSHIPHHGGDIMEQPYGRTVEMLNCGPLGVWAWPTLGVPVITYEGRFSYPWRPNSPTWLHA